MTEEKAHLAKKYERINLVISISETIISIALILAFVISGYSMRLRDLVSSWSDGPYWQLLAFVLVVGAVSSVLSFPLSIFSDFWLERHFDLSNQTFGSWLWEKFKGFLVGSVLMLPLLLFFYFFLLNYPQTWWIWMGTVLFFFSVIIGKIAPQVIFPLFYKFEKLDNLELLQKMQSLAEKGKFALEGVYRFNMSKTTKKANAAFTGLGKTRRIIIGDTLLENFSDEEIESVFAHEVGHYHHKHITQGVIIGTISSFLGLFISALVYAAIVEKYFFDGPADLAALPLLVLVISLFSILTAPITNAWSRHNERQADRFALEYSSRPEVFIDALKKLANQNLSNTNPHPLVEFLFHSHPSVDNRVKFAENILGSNKKILPE